MTKSISYGLIGAKGKMGNEISTVLAEHSANLVFTYDIEGEWMGSEPEVIIDFSLPTAFDKTVEYVNKFKIPLVIGTTGLSSDQMNILKELSQSVAVVQSFNFSVGIQLLLKSIEAIKDLTQDWDIEITEVHHRFKKDKPSGTALMLKNAVGRDVPISSLRLGNVPGDHTISFGGLGEVISLSHHAISRRTFAEGVALATHYVLGKEKGLYTFNDVIEKR